ncbi:hypothetical protein MGG_16048 [Pyricularia oryzae 70-15]|uniref:Uncharacterized protein n=2 Tax=Pyricularia oryzae TaxID=318829 RepID=G4MP72_PYRO7|nr:uncharacterized protein MGG_16048 [Pyricularia oryzae 70-15]EHA56331.1 hypothetical protein MGG_16048 [Pyricularia oryzae 70-15]
MAKCWCILNHSISEHYTKLACRKTGSLIMEGNNIYCFKGVTLSEWETACENAGADGGNCNN